MGINEKESDMKLLITGSRGICRMDLTPYVPAEVDCIIIGGAKGVDALAERFAEEHGIETVILRPQYARYGRAAPLKRDEEMVLMADRVLAIWDGQSRGTKYTIDYAKKQGKDLLVLTLPPSLNDPPR